MGETEAVRGYPSHWEADVVLRDGATAHLRPISPEDAAELQRMHAGQSENSIYLRYFTYKSELSAKGLDRFTHVDHRDRVAFVITRGGRLLGVGRYDRYGDSDAAEVAFNISDAAQGRGLGSILMEHLAVAARENGIRRFTAEVLPENRKMLYVPRGFAHGFITLRDNTEAFYMVSDPYMPGGERGLRYNDPHLGIEWPLQPEIASEKDLNWPAFDPDFHGVEQLRGLR